MKTVKTNRAAIAVLMVAVVPLVVGTAQARTDVKAKVEQLNENVGASKTNLQQYETNLRTVVANLNETERALKTIEKQKQAITKQTGQSAKDQSSVTQAKVEVESYLKKERELLTAEERQIEDLKASLQRIEANKSKRESNILAYEERLKSVEADRTAWTERNQSVADLDNALKAKEDEARAERKRLQTKKAEYEEEIGKWKKQVRLSERAASSFRGLKEQ